MTTTTLKIIAMIAMLMDHIQLFFPTTPLLFRWIGRISAPIFLYFCAIGYSKTSNKKRFFRRIYVLSIIMELWKLFMGIEFLSINFIRTLTVTIVAIYIFECFKFKNKNRYYILLCFIGWQYITSTIIDTLMSAPGISNTKIDLVKSILINILNLDGGIIFVLIGLFMYIYKDNIHKLSLSFIILTLVYILLFNTNCFITLSNLLLSMSQSYYECIEFVQRILDINTNAITSDLLFGNFQWMMVFSLLFIQRYNGERGMKLKYLFYIFYPAHVCILYVLAASV